MENQIIGVLSVVLIIAIFFLIFLTKSQRTQRDLAKEIQRLTDLASDQAKEIENLLKSPVGTWCHLHGKYIGWAAYINIRKNDGAPYAPDDYDLRRLKRVSGDESLDLLGAPQWRSIAGTNELGDEEILLLGKVYRMLPS